jgi:asparagine N-glycosylation enzyme membrane subunit Stt3
MIMANTDESSSGEVLQNGAGAAAILAAGIGCAALGVLSLLGDAFNGIKNFLNFYNPAGPLSGVTILAIVVWLAAWFVLAKKWDGRDVAMTRVSVVAFALLAVGFALTFPPFMDLLQGK